MSLHGLRGRTVVFVWKKEGEECNICEERGKSFRMWGEGL